MLNIPTHRHGIHRQALLVYARSFVTAFTCLPRHLLRHFRARLTCSTASLYYFTAEKFQAMMERNGNFNATGRWAKNWRFDRADTQRFTFALCVTALRWRGRTTLLTPEDAALLPYCLFQAGGTRRRANGKLELQTSLRTNARGRNDATHFPTTNTSPALPLQNHYYYFALKRTSAEELVYHYTPLLDIKQTPAQTGEHY